MSRTNRVRKYTLEKSESRYIECLKGIQFSNEWLTIDDGYATVKAGYSWNGATPKFKLYGKVLSTPDGKEDQLKKATLWHDVLYQFSKQLQNLGVLRKDVDLLFLRDLVDKAWNYAILYYRIVRLFGWMTFG